MFTFRGTFTNLGLHLMQILGLLGLYSDAVVVFFKKTSLLFRFALAILCFEAASN